MTFKISGEIKAAFLPIDGNARAQLYRRAQKLTDKIPVYYYDKIMIKEARTRFLQRFKKQIANALFRLMENIEGIMLAIPTISFLKA